jgi:hypothetical protein
MNESERERRGLCLPSRLAVCFSAPKQIGLRMRSGNQGVLPAMTYGKLVDLTKLAKNIKNMWKLADMDET